MFSFALLLIIQNVLDIPIYDALELLRRVIGYRFCMYILFFICLNDILSKRTKGSLHPTCTNNDCNQSWSVPQGKVVLVCTQNKLQGENYFWTMSSWSMIRKKTLTSFTQIMKEFVQSIFNLYKLITFELYITLSSTYTPPFSIEL